MHINYNSSYETVYHTSLQYTHECNSRCKKSLFPVISFLHQEFYLEVVSYYLTFKVFDSSEERCHSVWNTTTGEKYQQQKNELELVENEIISYKIWGKKITSRK